MKDYGSLGGFLIGFAAEDNGKEKPMSEVGIIGAGTMGHGIAQCFAVKGMTVRITDADPNMLASVPARITANLKVFVEAGMMTAEKAHTAPEQLILCDSLLSAVEGASVIIETISEDLDLKRRLFAQLEELTSPSTILCTNTSALSITAISQDLRHPDRVVGTHFWNPPHVLPCVEVIKSRYTSEEVFEKTVAVMAAIGKEPIRVLKDVPGFIGNRMQHALQREAMDIVDQGIATPEEVDRVVKYGFGLRLALMGPLERSDQGGLDITYRVQKYLLPFLCNQTEPSPLLAQKVAAGDLGVKSGQGYYPWPPEKTAETLKARDRQLLELIRLIHQHRNAKT
jgi:3-hydroxybutyryl-CoA dehydrogenase